MADRDISSDETVRSDPFDSVREVGGKAEPGERIGRYRVLKKLGGGAFGEVFLAKDETLARGVAIKVLNRSSGLLPNEEEVLEEGRTLARLDHPGIVPIHDVGRTGDGRLFLVSKFVEGITLANSLWKAPMGSDQAVHIVAKVADALAYAHQSGVIHRDVKPGNIIIADDGRPILIDFGIAMATGGQRIEPRSIVGTPGYMSPEQARGESHLVDGRSDIFSLGAVLYETITGRRAFEGRPEDLLDRLASPSLEVVPPRQIVPSIPKALERICLKALSKRTLDRYSTALDFAEELRAYLETAEEKNGADESTVNTPWITPKGLRAFDADDAGFFLQLLPGVRDHAGNPNGLRFWLRGIADEIDPFRVGVLYGPSGSGKTSFLNAGLLPRLPESVETIYVQAGVENVEQVLVDRILRLFPGLASGEGMASLNHRIRATPAAFLAAAFSPEEDEDEESFEAGSPRAGGGPGVPENEKDEGRLGALIRTLREGRHLPQGNKLLIVIDQFEQWLHRHEGPLASSGLVTAMRQCDGRHVQVLLTVRDDFWMAVGDLAAELDVELLQSRNAAAIDLFDRDHAAWVLRQFGQAFGRLPLPGEDSGPDPDGEAFVAAAIDDMVRDGKIVPLQLALFSEMSKGVPWRGDTYRLMGGATAIGVQYLDSMLSRKAQNPVHRAQEVPARAILEALLPPGTITLKGFPIGSEELMRRAGLESNPAQFDKTMLILDQELRLVTPVESESEEGSPREEGKKLYQLSHDYLVPALREWLHSGQRASIRGRTRLRFSELANAWRHERDPRHLPSLWEWLKIQVFVPRARWDQTEAALMKSASGKQGRRALAALGMAGLLAAAWGYVDRRGEIERQADMLLQVPALAIEAWERKKDQKQGAVIAEVRERLDRGTLPSEAIFNAHLILASKDPSHAPHLMERLGRLPIADVPVVIRKLVAAGAPQREAVWAQVDDPKLISAEKLRRAAYLAQIDHENPEWRNRGEDAVRWLLSAPDSETAQWAEMLSPVKDFLHSHLNLDEEQFRLMDSTKARRTAVALAEWNGSNPNGLTELLYRVRREETALVIDKLQTLGEGVEPILVKDVERYLKEVASGGRVGETVGKRAARAAVAWLRLGPSGKDNIGWQLLEFRPDPTGRSRLIHLMSPAGIDPAVLFQEAREDLSVSTREAVIQSLGSYDPATLTQSLRGDILQWLSGIYQSEPDPGLHASAGWLFNKWAESAPDFKPGLVEAEKAGGKWFVSAHGATFTIIEVPQTRGIPKGLPSRFAMAQTEVTVEEFLKSDIPGKWDGRVSPFMDCPMGNVTSTEMMRFANWVSQAEGIAEEQWCYREVNGEMEPVQDLQKRTGYRLPTLAEWRHAAAAGAVTDWPFGSGVDVIEDFAGSDGGVRDRITSSVRTFQSNRFGLFEVIGNVNEYCHKPIGTKWGFGFSGGSVDTFADELHIDRFVDMGIQPWYSRIPTFGFRLARTLSETPSE